MSVSFEKRQDGGVFGKSGGLLEPAVATAKATAAEALLLLKK